MHPTTRLFDYKVALVLEDEHGEFEIRDAIRFDAGGPRVMIDLQRALDAVHGREAEYGGRTRQPRRKVY